MKVPFREEPGSFLRAIPGEFILYQGMGISKIENDYSRADVNHRLF